MYQYAAAVAVFFALVVSPSLGRTEPLVSVERYVWTDSIDIDKRQYNGIYTPPVKAKKAYLWMQLKGSKQLLEKLRESPNGSMPIRHLWYRYNSIGVVSDGAVDFDVGRREDLQKLAYDVNANGFFRWRIWSGKERLAKGWWRVDLVYEANDEPVNCPTSTNEQNPCSFEIEVR